MVQPGCGMGRRAGLFELVDLHLHANFRHHQMQKQVVVDALMHLDVAGATEQINRIKTSGQNNIIEAEIV